MDQPAHGDLSDRPPQGRLFWAGLVAGGAVMAFGIAGALVSARETRPIDLARWFFGAAVAHDAILAPAAGLIGVALTRLVPGRFRAPVQGGVIVTGVVVLFSVPLVRRDGVRPDNPTVLFRDYGAALLVVLGGVWVVTAALVALSCSRRRARGEASAPERCG
jgi:hypothetical protein